MRILDLCCGHGLAAIGYKKHWPDAQIVGWDILDLSGRYPFEFVRGDAFGVTYDYLETFDFIHISPPCQRYSKITPKKTRMCHPHLIPNALLLGYASGKPFVVENVPGSTQWLKPTVSLVAGGKVRHFHTNFPVEPRGWPHVFDIMSSSYSSKRDVYETWGIPHEYNLRMRDLRQGIPPIMTEHIAKYATLAK